jgi:hypothetical protein
MIRPTSPNPNQERDFWNNREPAESFINTDKIHTVAGDVSVSLNTLILY